MSKSSPKGFTLIEVLVAMFIVAIISLISYRTLSNIIQVRETLTRDQNKWQNISLIVSTVEDAWNSAIPLTVRDSDDVIIIPALLGKNGKLTGPYDGQLSMTLAGHIGDNTEASVPPKRITLRFSDNNLYLITWPVLNRVATTVPRIDLVAQGVKSFSLKYLYPTGQWGVLWPDNNIFPSHMPYGLRLDFTMDSGEEISRTWLKKQ